MDLNGVPPPSIDWSASNLPEAWRQFDEHTDLIFKGPLKDKTEDVKITYLLLWIGKKGRDIHKTLPLSEEQKTELQSVRNAFRNHVQPKLNPVFSRFKFNNEIQGENTVEQFITNIRILARDCKFANPDEMIRDRIVFGVRSQRIREKLIHEGEKLSMDKAIEICQNFEYAQEQLKTMKEPSAAAVSVNSVHRPQQQRTGRTQDRQARRVDVSKAPARRRQDPEHNACYNCGQKHSKNAKCPAHGKQCHQCKKWNHFGVVCRSKKVNDIEQQDHSYVFIDTINSRNKSGQAFTDIVVGPNKYNVQFKIDTGAQVNILPLSVFQKLGLKAVARKSNNRLFAYNGHELKVRGCISLECKHVNSGRCGMVTFHIIDTQSSPLLGLQSCVDLNLIKIMDNIDCEIHEQSKLTKSSVLKAHKRVFEGIGLFPGECEISIDPNAVPVVHPPRKIPVALQDRVKDELSRMEKLGVISKVDEPTSWVNSMAIAEKGSGKIRICLDPRDLNKSIMRPHYPMRTLDDILPQLAGAKYFTKLDARSGYWSIKLSDRSSFLTTFNTNFGRYRYLRLPFGLKSSGDEFIRKIDQCFEGLDGVVAIVDDILVFGRTRAEHDKHLSAVLQRSFERGIRFNEEKLEVGVTSVNYFGHVLSDEGVKPDPSKVKAIREMQAPTNKKELETLLGMVTYLSRFAPNLSAITSPMRKLLSKDVEFSWDRPQAEAFSKVKEILTNPGKVLAYYDPKKQLVLQVDASKFGLGATIMQDNKPVAYASKSLTPSEVKYAQIEKEMLAIVFGCERFHQFVYGRKVLVQTDHRPLVSIHDKPLCSAPMRLQRMLLRLQRYDLDLKYVPGRDLHIADALSRNFLNESYPELSKGIELQVNMVMSSLPVSDRKLQEIRTETRKDEQMSALNEVILNGWPNERKQCQSEVIPFWNFRDELSVVDGLIMKGHKIVIPKSLRSKMLEIIHVAHFGVDKCLRRAREVIFWPGISADITQLVLSCSVCLQHRNRNQKEPLMSYEIPDYPWQVTACDLFTLENKTYLVVVDLYSRYFEVKELSDHRSNSVINHLKSIFSHWGISEKVISDNEGCFSSEQFTTFAREWDFKHVTSSPHYPKSNGLAEKYVQISKRILTKARVNKQDPFIALLEYRSCPLSDVGYSPAQLAMGRQLRSVLPTAMENLVPKAIPPHVIKGKIGLSKQRSKVYHDMHAKELKPFNIGDSARIMQSNLWKPAVVTEKHSDRSYSVKTEDGGVYRRNRRDLLKPSLPNPVSVTDSEIEIKENDSSVSLESQEQITPQSPENSQTTTGKESSSQSSDIYITRYGRTVKPRIIESM